MPRWEGEEHLDSERWIQELRPKAERAILRAAVLFVNEWKKTLSGPRSGRVYRVSKTGRLHVASAPGEPPAVLYGRLRQSIAHTGPTWQGLTVSAEVGTNVIYARPLEFGFVNAHGVRVLARPHFEPTRLRTEPAIERILEEALQ